MAKKVIAHSLFVITGGPLNYTFALGRQSFVPCIAFDQLIGLDCQAGPGNILSATTGELVPADADTTLIGVRCLAAMNVQCEWETLGDLS